jgi:hypothetical protein
MPSVFACDGTDDVVAAIKDEESRTLSTPPTGKWLVLTRDGTDDVVAAIKDEELRTLSTPPNHHHRISMVAFLAIAKVHL